MTRVLHLTLDSIVDAVAENNQDFNRKSALSAVSRFLDGWGGPENGDTGKEPRFVVQGHECDLSPIGVCIGDQDDDEFECVFCGNPDERK